MHLHVLVAIMQHKNMILRQNQCQKLTGTREVVVSVFMEGTRHDSVSEVERFLHSVSMVNINIKIQYTWVISADPKFTLHLLYGHFYGAEL